LAYHKYSIPDLEVLRVKAPDFLLF
jgi:hypothetical protein